MKKALSSVILLICIVFTFVSCSGYNSTMINHLSNINNYTEYECTFLGAEETDGGLSIMVALPEEPNGNLKNNYQYSDTKKAYVSRFELTGSNYRALIKSEFFDNVISGEKITIKVSDYIYSDTNFHFVIAVKAGGTVYLDEKIGLQNLKTMMNQNKSPF